jgi:uncharacterized membrane protein (DUF485 family)
MPEREGQVSTSERAQSDDELPESTQWAAVQASPDFVELRRRLRRFVFPMTALFLVWYLVYVLLADYAHGFMSTKVVGNINVALIMGVLQFVSTFVITMVYVRYANRNLDPKAEAIRAQIEGAGQ